MIFIVIQYTSIMGCMLLYVTDIITIHQAKTCTLWTLKKCSVFYILVGLTEGCPASENMLTGPKALRHTQLS